MKEVIENLKSRKQVIDFAKQENINLIELDFNDIFTDFVPANLKNETYLLRGKIGRSYILVLLRIYDRKEMVIKKVSFGDGEEWRYGGAWFNIKNKEGKAIVFSKAFFENIESLISAYFKVRFTDAWKYCKYFR